MHLCMMRKATGICNKIKKMFLKLKNRLNVFVMWKMTNLIHTKLSDFHQPSLRYRVHHPCFPLAIQNPVALHSQCGFHSRKRVNKAGSTSLLPRSGTEQRLKLKGEEQRGNLWECGHILGCKQLPQEREFVRSRQHF